MTGIALPSDAESSERPGRTGSAPPGSPPAAAFALENEHDLVPRRFFLSFGLRDSGA